jgi:hypothetical protein
METEDSLLNNSISLCISNPASGVIESTELKKKLTFIKHGRSPVEHTTGISQVAE